MVGQDMLQDFNDEMSAIFNSFAGDTESTNVKGGMISKTSLMRKPRMKVVQGKTNEHFYRLMKQVEKGYLRKLVDRDKAYRKRVRGLKDPDKIEIENEAHRKEMERIQEVASSHVEALYRDIEEMARLAGGSNEFIDTSQEMADWNHTYLGQLEGLKIDEKELDRAMEEGLDAGFDIQYYAGKHNESALILRKISDPEKDLEPEDYKTVAKLLEPYFYLNFDAEKQDKMKKTVHAVHNSGALTLLHAMESADRLKVGEAIMDDPSKSESEKKRGILVVASLGYLEVAQVENLLGQGKLDNEEAEKIRVTQEMVAQISEKLAGIMDDSNPGNSLNKFGTASNFLLYEIAARAAGFGMALSALMNIKNLPSLFVDPIFLGLAAVTGISMEHVSSEGNKGEGVISEFFADLKKDKTDTPEELFEQKKYKELIKFVGGNPETVELLFNNDAELLTAIVERADNEKDPGLYEFQFNDMEDEIRDHYEIEDVDGRSIVELERKIAQFYSVMRRDLGIGSVEDMLDEVHIIQDEEFGLTG